MPIPFASEAWIRALQAALNQSETYRAAAPRSRLAAIPKPQPYSGIRGGPARRGETRRAVGWHRVLR